MIVAPNPHHSKHGLVRRVKRLTSEGRELYERLLPKAKEIERERYGEEVPLRAACGAYSETLNELHRRHWEGQKGRRRRRGAA